MATWGQLVVTGAAFDAIEGALLVGVAIDVVAVVTVVAGGV